ncbi:methylenetetrahydrofolate reductase [Nitrosophilus kaiyonis]|uniref:methylenetetrahydrofolate reductase n=1 Tax=Nitrosophilus kaiyonis TaxID=2930200 RepID=UPI0024927AD0|nr:methylenetetrahydrofolate reductase [Nitrosophilus kaiyonis]
MFENLINKLREDRFITLETTPGHEPTIEPIIKKLENLKNIEKLCGFTTTDNPLARLKYNSILASIKLQNRFKKPVIATISMRDRNKIALQSDLLGANDFDIRAILALTGDPAKISDQPNTKGVFEGDSTLLLDIIKCFNAGIDYAGKPFKIRPKKIYPFAVSNAYAKKDTTLAKKFAKKIEHGAVGIITQPVFDVENAKNLLNIFEQTRKNFSNEKAKSELIFGFFPITKLRTAQFLASHVPGINVPSNLVDILYKANKISEEEEFKVGIEFSKNLFKELLKIHPKIHIMTANKFELADEILNNI